MQSVNGPNRCVGNRKVCYAQTLEWGILYNVLPEIASGLKETSSWCQTELLGSLHPSRKLDWEQHMRQIWVHFIANIHSSHLYLKIYRVFDPLTQSARQKCLGTGGSLYHKGVTAVETCSLILTRFHPPGASMAIDWRSSLLNVWLRCSVEAAHTQNQQPWRTWGVSSR